jgi:hypothetical protein
MSAKIALKGMQFLPVTYPGRQPIYANLEAAAGPFGVLSGRGGVKLRRQFRLTGNGQECVHNLPP